MESFNRTLFDVLVDRGRPDMNMFCSIEKASSTAVVPDGCHLMKYHVCDNGSSNKDYCPGVNAHADSLVT